MATASYLDLSDKPGILEESGTTAVKNYFLQINAYAAFHADRFPFYGYSGAHDDNISLLENAADLNDTLLHALANAFFGKAKDLLITTTDSTSEKAKTELTDQEVKTYLDYSKKCVSNYEKIVKRNPQYATWVAKVSTKMSNDIVALYQELVLRNRAAEAQILLTSIQYPNSVLDYGYNVLSSCDSNAIVISNGDTDTYSLWYWQSKGFRTDVAVMNSSMTNSPFYCIAFVKYYALPIDLTDAFLESDLSAVMLMDKESEEAVEIASLFRQFAEHVELNGEKKNPEKEDYFSASPNISLPVSAEKRNGKMVLNYTQKYIYRTDLFFLNILKNNAWKRPIYFTFLYDWGFDVYVPYAMREGFLTRLNDNAPDPAATYQRNDLEKIDQNLLHVYQYSKLEVGLEEELVLLNALMVYYYLADDLIKLGDNKAALNALNVGIEHYPIEHFKDPSLFANFAWMYLTLNETEKARGLILEISTILATTKLDDESINRYLYFADFFQSQGLKKEASTLRKALKSK